MSRGHAQILVALLTFNFVELALQIARIFRLHIDLQLHLLGQPFIPAPRGVVVRPEPPVQVIEAELRTAQ